MVVLLLLIGGAYFFQDEIIGKFISEANKNINTKVSYDKIGLTVFKSFPSVSVRLNF